MSTMRNEVYHGALNLSLPNREGGKGDEEDDIPLPFTVCKGWRTIHVGDFPTNSTEEPDISSSSSTSPSLPSRNAKVDLVHLIEADREKQDNSSVQSNADTDDYDCDDIVWPPPEFQSIRQRSEPRAILRSNNGERGGALDRRRGRTGWVRTTTPSPRISVPLWRRRKRSPTRLPVSPCLFGPCPEEGTRSPSDVDPAYVLEGSSDFGSPTDHAELGDIPTMIYINDMALTERVDHSDNPRRAESDFETESPFSPEV